MANYLEACEFFSSLREPLEFVDNVESFLANANAPCTPYLTKDNRFIATLELNAQQFWYRILGDFGK